MRNAIWARAMLSRVKAAVPGTLPSRRAASGARLPGQATVLELRVLPSATPTGVDFDSAIGIGNGVDGSHAWDMDIDAAGNRYVSGSFAGTVDFDETAARAGDTDILAARGRNDIYVAKYAPDQSLIWVTQMGGDAQGIDGLLSDFGRSIKVDASGSVIVSGDFAETASFGSTTLVSSGGNDAFVAKLNASGVVQWARSWGTSTTEYGFGVGSDAAGNVYAASQRPNDSIEIRKFSATGKAVWTQGIASRLEYQAHGGFTVDPSGNVYVADNFRGTVDFDPSGKTKLVTANRSSAYVLSLDTQGKYRWVSPLIAQANSNSYADSLVWDSSSGTVIVGGSYHGNVDMNPGTASLVPPSAAGWSGFLDKLLASTGALVWNRNFEGSGVSILGLDVDSQGNLYTSGQFRDNTDFDPGSDVDIRTADSEGDVFVAKLSAAGNLVWVEAIGGVGANWSYAIGVDPSGGVSVTGTFLEGIDVDPDPIDVYQLTTTPPKYKAFLLRWLQV